MSQKDIVSTSDMMRALEDEIELVKSGKITEAVGRVVFRGRALQIQTASLNLQYKRMLQGKKPTQEMKFIENKEPDKPEEPKKD